METFWQVAATVAGIGAVGAFVLWGIYRKWLDVGKATFAALTKEQTYNLFWLVLVLTFLFALAALIAYVWTHQQPAPQPVKAADKAEGTQQPPDDRLAKLTDYGGADWQDGGFDEEEGKRQFVVVHKKQPAPVQPAPDDPEEPEPKLYHAVAFDLSKVTKQDPVRVKAVRVVYAPLEGELVQVTGYYPHPNVRPPLIYSAEIRKGKVASLAALVEQNGKKDFNSSVLLTDAEPHIKVIMGFTGDPGLYRVHVAVDLEEVKGDRKDTVRTGRCVYIGVSPKLNHRP